MRKKHLPVVFLSVIVLVVLASCSGGIAGDAKAFLQALGKADQEAARKYTSQGLTSSVQQNLDAATYFFAFDAQTSGGIKRVSCKAYGEGGVGPEVECKVSFAKPGRFSATVLLSFNQTGKIWKFVDEGN